MIAQAITPACATRRALPRDSGCTQAASLRILAIRDSIPRRWKATRKRDVRLFCGFGVAVVRPRLSNIHSTPSPES